MCCVLTDTCDPFPVSTSAAKYVSPTKTQVASSRSFDSDAVVPLQTIQGTYVCIVSRQTTYLASCTMQVVQIASILCTYL